MFDLALDLTCFSPVFLYVFVVEKNIHFCDLVIAPPFACPTRLGCGFEA